MAGLVLVRQRPGSAHGTVFLTLEDETGAANIIVWPKVFEANRSSVIAARLLCVRGTVQKTTGVVHLVADRMEDLSGELNALGEAGPALTDLARADEVKRPQTFASMARGQGAALGAKIGFPLAEDARRAQDPGLAPAEALPQTLPLPLAAGDVRRAMPKGRNFQ